MNTEDKTEVKEIINEYKLLHSQIDNIEKEVGLLLNKRDETLESLNKIKKRENIILGKLKNKYNKTELNINEIYT